MRLGPAHTRGDTAIFVEGDGVLFSGDLAMNKAFPAFATPQSRANTWITSLDALRALRPAQVVGAHYGMGDASLLYTLETEQRASRRAHDKLCSTQGAK